MTGKGILTPKSHESHGNILRPAPLRSRFFSAETPRMPWYNEDKENFVQRPLGNFGYGEKEKKCLRCYDKATFILEPCSHTYNLILYFLMKPLCKMHDNMY